VSDSLTVGKGVRLAGKVLEDKNGFYFSNPVWELSSREPTNTGRLVPVYSETEGLTSKWIRWQMQNIFKMEWEIADPIPATILTELHLPPIKTALEYIHFPKTETQYLLAQKRFAFQNMLTVQLASLKVKANWEKETAVKIPFQEKNIQKFTASLPFTLTNAQRKASFEILKDLEKTRPMNRLLNGDVGSGKTIVAALASLQTAQAGFQTALMAPTEVLARQHYDNISKLFSAYNISIGLLTSTYQEASNLKFKTCLPVGKVSNFKLKANIQNTKLKRAEMLAEIKEGHVDILIGTHALIQKDVRFKKLALVIIDEQHRFGVGQRAFLQRNALTNADLTPTNTESDLLYEDITYKIRGAVFNVKKQLGLGHKEIIYQKALAEEFKKFDLSFSKEFTIAIKYDDKKIGTYRPDFIIENKIILELKALPSIGKFETQQVWHYLKGSDYKLALLINFGRNDVAIERLIHTGLHKSASSPQKSAFMPHLLTMTATPIPRTLTMAYFGNLDLSLLDEMPLGRKPIITKIIPPNKRNEVYDFVRKEVSSGRQVFIIFPLVEESEKLVELKAATAEHERLSRDIFPELSLGLLHGKLKAKEKEVVMADYKNKKYDILVATSVVEVGIDVPNATVIIIEDAERFGLSQLHQFRGRVGRSQQQSYCFLLTGSHTIKSKSRLGALEKTNSGFEIAEADLKMRGPGEFLGLRQSGLPDIAMEHLGNVKLIEISRQKALELLKNSPSLSKYPLLKKELTKFATNVHLE
jgi:ATP-dependent DNA helicase RecG